MSELLEAALWHASHGHPCFPCNPVTKRPITPRGFKDATTDVRAIREWFTDRRVLLACRLLVGEQQEHRIVDDNGAAGQRDRVRGKWIRRNDSRRR